MKSFVGNSMSRWSDQFEAHPIHEALRQLREWTFMKIKNIDPEHETEQRRLIKILDMIIDILAGMDPEYFPTSGLNQLNTTLRNPSIWNKLNAYSNDGNVEHLKLSNNQLDVLLPHVYQIATMSIKFESRKVIRNTEKAFDDFCEVVEKKRDETTEATGNAEKKFNAIRTKVKNLSTSLDDLKTATDNQISIWKIEFTNAQTTQTQEHSASQIARNEQYDETLRNFQSTAEMDLTNLKTKQDKEFSAAFNLFESNAKNKTKDIDNKHNNILKIHDLVANDGVAGSYKKGADTERSAARFWSGVSMVCYALILGWVIFKGRLGFGIAQVGEIDWPLIVTTVSVTAVAFIAAQFAGNQARSHRINEQRMRWFSFEIAAIDPFISSLKPEDQQELKRQLSERLFGQERTFDEVQKRSSDTPIAKQAIDALSENSAEMIKLFAKNRPK